MTDRKFGFKTRALHAGGQPDDRLDPLVVGRRQGPHGPGGDARQAFGQVGDAVARENREALQCCDPPAVVGRL